MSHLARLILLLSIFLSFSNAKILVRRSSSSSGPRKVGQADDFTKIIKSPQMNESGEKAPHPLPKTADPIKEDTDWHGERYALWQKIRHIVPRTYHVPRVNRNNLPKLDGNPHSSAWDGAKWTGLFQDIEGSPPRKQPRFATRVRMLWQSEDDGEVGVEGKLNAGLWIGATMEEPYPMGTLHRNNFPIFHYDHDFEVFVNCDGSTHNYFEFEMNARDVTWQLQLPKPYSEGGKPIDPQECPGLQSAVVVHGHLDDGKQKSKGWDVTLFFPFKGLYTITKQDIANAHAGDFWRLSFSRVELPIHIDKEGNIVRDKTKDGRPAPEDNWTWSPQGVVDMHRPERWPFIVFEDSTEGGPVPASSSPPDPYWKEREYLTMLFHYQHDYYDKFKFYATEPQLLTQDDPELAKRTDIITREDYWAARISLGDDKWMSIRQDGLTLVHSSSDPSSEKQVPRASSIAQPLNPVL